METIIHKINDLFVQKKNTLIQNLNFNELANFSIQALKIFHASASFKSQKIIQVKVFDDLNLFDLKAANLIFIPFLF
jgi:hypothetical protein